MSATGFHRDRARAASGALVPGLAVALALALAGWSVAQAQGLADFRRIGGDSLNYRLAPDGERVSELTGNVYFDDGEARVTADRGQYFSVQHLIVAVGNTIVRSDSLTLWTDSLRVYRDTDIGHAYGNVRIETNDGNIGTGDRGHYRREDGWLALAGSARVIDGPTVIEGDSIIFDRASGTIEAFGAVKVIDNDNRSVVEGRHGFFDREYGLAIVDSFPLFRSRRGDGPVTTVIGDWMSFDDESESSTAIGNVDFRQGETRAHADTARFVGEDLLILSGGPSVEQQGRIMEGDEIRFHYVEGELEHIDVTGGASLVDSTPDSLESEFTNIPLANTLSGDSLKIYVVEGEIVRTYVRGHAKSVYLPEDQTAAISLNEVEGNSIDIVFKNGQVDAVTVLGNVAGSYRYLERAKLEDILARPDSLVTELESLPARLDGAIDSLAIAAVIDSLPAAPADSALTALARVDSALVGLATVDSTSLDSMALVSGDSVIRFGPRIDFVAESDEVIYHGQSTVFAVQDGQIHISDEASVRNGTLELFAHEVFFDTDKQELLAEGDPRLVDQATEIVGDRMGYLFEPATGAVGEGATRFDDGYYYGRHIRRIDQEVLLVRDGTYTACELEHPHYHFSAKKMKLRVGKTVVARQVMFHLSEIPLLPLPFYYKNLTSGRRSGILFPNLNLGVSSRDGRYIRDFGYYWATNDYTDFKFEFDFNERRDATFQIENNYNVRYGYSGRARFEYLSKFSATEEGDEWKFTARHNQPELFDVWRASANVEISSKDVTRTNLGTNVENDLIDSQLRSTASVSRSFDNGASMSLGLTRNQFPNSEDENLLTNNALSNLQVPVSVGFKTRPLLGGRKRSSSPMIANVLRDITFSQSYRGSYARDIAESSDKTVLNGSGSFGLSYNPGSVGPFKLRSSASFGEAWSYENSSLELYKTIQETVQVDDSTTTTVDRIVLDEDRSVNVDESDSRPSLSFSNSVSSDLYGVFTPRIGPIRGIKHKLSWSVNHTFRPEIGDKQVRSQSIGLRMGNELSLKIRDGDKTDDEGNEKTRKLDQLVNWSLSTSVDPDAEPGEKWRNITSSVRLRPGITQAISFSMNQTIDPYTLDVLSTRFNSDLRLRGGFDLGGVLRQREERQNKVLERLPPAVVDSAATDSLTMDPDDPFGDRAAERRERNEWLDSGDKNRVPWDLYLRGSLTQTRNVDGSTTSRANLSTRNGFSLPGEWKVSYSADFDVESGEFTNQFWRVSRKLHHWRLEFSRGLADGQDFGFSLYLEEIPDLRVDRGDRARSRGVRNRLDSF